MDMLILRLLTSHHGYFVEKLELRDYFSWNRSTINDLLFLFVSIYRFVGNFGEIILQGFVEGGLPPTSELKFYAASIFVMNA